jgi:hypothetical protein
MRPSFREACGRCRNSDASWKGSFRNNKIAYLFRYVYKFLNNCVHLYNKTLFFPECSVLFCNTNFIVSGYVYSAGNLDRTEGGVYSSICPVICHHVLTVHRSSFTPCRKVHNFETQTPGVLLALLFPPKFTFLPFRCCYWLRILEMW